MNLQAIFLVSDVDVDVDASYRRIVRVIRLQYRISHTCTAT